MKRLQVLTILCLLFLGSSIGYYVGTNGWFVLGWYLLLFGLVCYFLLKDGVDLKSLFSIKPKHFFKSLLAIPILYLVLIPVSLVFSTLNEPIESVKLNFPMVVSLVAVGPLAEEMIFRVYFQDLLRKRFNVNATIILSSIFFAVLHPVSIFPQVFVIAVFLSTLREIYGSITPSVVVHCLNNAVAMLFSALT
ncbi:CPBP family intramembrane glutamic endopeptidase [Pseudothermotoga thermarum]|uniref:Abortive infection protein n=1 Tax=Pseudothermotoga thermarum DSM 5069 TaxID=688269 RepID=F7YXS1_9THEM|nr:type II CAAX endopeptidase family protein [Pseudothermotoga thermarum]AEH50715.1 Abortive infection protein [Pseudothermotoga thermarum DSM 5069]